MIAQTVTIALPIFLAVVAFAAVGAGWLASLIVDVGPPPDPAAPLWDDPCTEEELQELIARERRAQMHRVYDQERGA